MRKNMLDLVLSVNYDKENARSCPICKLWERSCPICKL